MNIGQRIKQRREELDISQEELAKKAGYKSRSSINKIEVDGRGLPQSKIVLIAEALKTTPAYLMGWDESPNPEITYDDVERLVARNGKNLTTEQKMRLIKLLSEIE